MESGVARLSVLRAEVPVTENASSICITSDVVIDTGHYSIFSVICERGHSSFLRMSESAFC